MSNSIEDMVALRLDGEAALRQLRTEITPHIDMIVKAVDRSDLDDCSLRWIALMIFAEERARSRGFRHAKAPLQIATELLALVGTRLGLRANGGSPKADGTSVRECLVPALNATGAERLLAVCTPEHILQIRQFLGDAIDSSNEVQAFANTLQLCRPFITGPQCGPVAGSDPQLVAEQRAVDMLCCFLRFSPLAEEWRMNEFRVPGRTTYDFTDYEGLHRHATAVVDASRLARGPRRAAATVGRPTTVAAIEPTTISAVAVAKGLCSYCRKPNHTAEQCYSLHPELRPPPRPSSGRARGAPPESTRQPNKRNRTWTAAPHTDHGSGEINAICSAIERAQVAAPIVTARTADGIEVNVMFDTGAAVTVMSLATVQRVGAPVDQSAPRLQLADGSTALVTIGTTRLELFMPAVKNSMQITAVVVSELAVDALIGRDMMWHRTDGNNVSFEHAGTSQVLIKVGATTVASVPAPASAAVGAVIRSAATAPEPTRAAHIAAEVAAELAQKGIADERGQSRLPRTLGAGHVPCVTNGPQYRELIGADREAWRVVADNIHAKLRERFPDVCDGIREDLEHYGSVFGGLMESDCLKFPPCSDLEPLVIALVPGGQVQLVPAGAMPMRQYEREFVDTQCDEMVKHGLIEPAQFAPALAQAFVHNNGVKMRLVVGMQKVNAATFPNHYPLPAVHDLHAFFAGFEFKATFDGWGAFHQIALDDQAVPLTTTSFAGKPMRFRVAPMGLNQSPGHLQRTLGAIVNFDTRDYSIRLYIDDIIVGAHSAAGLRAAIKELLKRLRSVHFTLSAKKAVIGDPRADAARRARRIQDGPAQGRPHRRDSRVRPADGRPRTARLSR